MSHTTCRFARSLQIQSLNSFFFLVLPFLDNSYCVQSTGISFTYLTTLIGIFIFIVMLMNVLTLLCVSCALLLFCADNLKSIFFYFVHFYFALLTYLHRFLTACICELKLWLILVLYFFPFLLSFRIYAIYNHANASF